MHHVLEQEVFIQRRKKLMSLLPENSAVILSSAQEKVRNGDCNYSFRQDSFFWYFTGFPEKDAIAVIINHKNEPFYLLFSRAKNHFDEIWSGHIIGPSEAKTIYAADETHSIDDAADKTATYLSQYGIKKIYSLENSSDPIFFRIKEFISSLRSAGGSANVAEYFDLTAIASDLRMVKSEEEHKLLIEAARISAAGHRAAMMAAKPGAYEYTVQAVLEAEFRRRKGCSPAFSTIVAGGINACCLHYVSNSSPLIDGDLILVDAGAEYAGYAGDISRTYPINGKFSREQHALYEIVLHAQKEAIASSVVGKEHQQVHNETAILLMQGLIDLKIIDGIDAKEFVDSGSYKRFYPHGTGHWLGLDTHDVGGYKDKQGKNRIYQAGMVVTVEPGIYIQHNDDSVDERWRGIGIRIEDDIIITEDQAQVISADIPKEVREIELVLANRS